jgi:hypothetical protein
MNRMFAIVLGAMAVIALLGFVIVPRAIKYFSNEQYDVKVNIISAEEDPDVAVPGTKDKTVARIVVEMEIIFPYGAAPEINNLRVRNEDGSDARVVWGSSQHPPDHRDIEDLSQTKFIFKEAFFPIDFKQGELLDGDRHLYTIKMPKLPYNVQPH